MCSIILCVILLLAGEGDVFSWLFPIGQLLLVPIDYKVMKFKDSVYMQKYASARVRGVVEPVCIVFMVIWAILLKETLAD